MSSLEHPPGLTLSIIIAGEDPSACIASLGALPAGVETIAVDRPGSLPERLAAGIERAQGDFVAMTETACTFAGDWLEHALKITAHTSASAIGGAIDPGSKLDTRSLGLYFCDYAQFLRPFQARETSDLPGSNVIFRRETLTGADLTKGFWKSAFCRQLAAAGHRLELDPSLVVHQHRRVTTSGLMRRRWNHGRCWGATRAETLTVASRGIYAIAGPLLPLLLTFRVIRRVWPKMRIRGELARSLPWIALSSAVWVGGEWVGNLFGAGDSCKFV